MTPAQWRELIAYARTFSKKDPYGFAIDLVEDLVDQLDALQRLAEAAMALDDQTLLWHTGEVVTDEHGPYQVPGCCVVCALIEGEHEDGCPVPPFRAAVAEWRALL